MVCNILSPPTTTYFALLNIRIIIKTITKEKTNNKPEKPKELMSDSIKDEIKKVNPVDLMEQRKICVMDYSSDDILIK